MCAIFKALILARVNEEIPQLYLPLTRLSTSGTRHRTSNCNCSRLHFAFVAMLSWHRNPYTDCISGQ